MKERMKCLVFWNKDTEMPSSSFGCFCTPLHMAHLSVKVFYVIFALPYPSPCRFGEAMFRTSFKFEFWSADSEAASRAAIFSWRRRELGKACGWDLTKKRSKKLTIYRPRPRCSFAYPTTYTLHGLCYGTLIILKACTLFALLILDCLVSSSR